MGSQRRIRTILYDDQKLEATELDLLHTPALQRLYDLHQLGLADRVFIDASHSRLHHVVGVLHQVENLLVAISRNLDAHPNRELTYGEHDGGQKTSTAQELATYVRKRRRAARLMGLLHDLTHSPFGHTLEDEIQVIKTKHDEPERQAKAFYRLLCQYVSWLTRDSGKSDFVEGTWGIIPRHDGGEDEPKNRLARYLDAPDLLDAPEDDGSMQLLASLAAKQLEEDSPARHMSREPRKEALRQFFHDLYFAMRGLLYLDCIHKPASTHVPKQVGSYPFEKLIQVILDKVGSPLGSDDSFLPQRDAFLLDVIGNTICADLLDYARRDSLFAGLKLNYDPDRIIENFTLVSHGDGPQGSFPTPLLRTAISMFSHKLRLDVPGELLNLLQVRFYLSQRVLFHPTKCIAGAMLGTALQLIGWKRLPQHFQYLGDAIFLHQVSESARIVRDLLQLHTVTTILTQELTASLFSTIDAIPVTGTILAARQLIEDRASQPLRAIRDDLRAAIRLLDRLAARRYHRTIFRALPDVNLHGMRPKNIADKVGDPAARSRIEREIERIAGLPPGTVVIHCPPGDGPVKIAAMLLVMEEDGRAHELRAIGELTNLFHEHQEAVKALETMYRSMWRLEVAVAPPFRPEFQRLENIVRQVLYKEITGKELGEHDLLNDPYMRRELEEATKKGLDGDQDMVHITDRWGEETVISWREYKVALCALNAARNLPTVSGFLQQPAMAASDGQGGARPPSIREVEMELSDWLTRSPVQSDAAQSVGGAIAGDLFAGVGEPLVLEWWADVFELPSDEKLANVANKEVARSAFASGRANLILALKEMPQTDRPTAAKVQQRWLAYCNEEVSKVAARKGKAADSAVQARSKDEWLKALRAKDAL
jgi:HD superfamily phosphohydrolase